MSSNHKLENDKNRHSSLFILIACYSVLIQIFSNNASTYFILRAGLYGLTFLLIFNLIISKTFDAMNRKIKLMIFVVYFSQIIRFVYIVLFDSKLIIEGTLFIPLLFVIVGNSIEFTQKNKKLLIYSYSLMTAFVGMYLVFKYGNGFALTNEYFFSQKNQVGAVIGASISLLLYKIFSDNDKLIRKPYLILLVIANIIPLFVLRNRTTMVAIILIIILIFVKLLLSGKDNMVTKLMLILIIMFSLTPSNSMIDYVYDSFFMNYDITDVNSISANRFESYLESIEFLSKNFIFGEIRTNSGIFDPHNFIIFNLLSNGALLSFGYLIVYFLFLSKLIKDWRILDIRNLKISNYLLIISYVGSIFEYMPPFGPGTTQMLAWFFIGNELRGQINGK